jgi:hypothetical protein
MLLISIVRTQPRFSRAVIMHFSWTLFRSGFDSRQGTVMLHLEKGKVFLISVSARSFQSIDRAIKIAVTNRATTAIIKLSQNAFDVETYLY